MEENNIIVFTKDIPSLEGGGKSIRMMNWLSHLSVQYNQVYCIYFYTSRETESGPDRFPENVVFVPILLETPSVLFSFFYRFFIGIIKPYEFSYFWYHKLSENDFNTIKNHIRKVNSILIFRLYLFPILVKIKQENPAIKTIAIDMDDAETDTYDQIGKQEWKHHEYKKWIINRLGKYYMNYYERHIPKWVNTIYYSHPQDVVNFRTVYPDKSIQHFPNRVPKVEWVDAKANKKNWDILFVGSLNYYPNEDAVYYLLKEIWPLIVRGKSDARLIIAGNKPGKSLRHLLTQTQSVTLIDNPKTIKKIFDNACLLIVPLRMAGGTRIKVMQAFSYGVPVVSTSIGVSGIDVRHNETALIGDAASDLASHCLELLNNPSMGSKIAKNAYTFYCNHHAFQC